MVYVTHDQLEASTFADKIAVMYGGQIVQFGTPRELFERPSHTFVGYFIGSPGMNLIEVQPQPGGVGFASTHLPLSDAQQVRIAESEWKTLKVGIRPEFVHVWEEPFDDAMQARVVHVEDLGTYKIMTLNLDGVPLKVRLAEDKPVPEGIAYISFPAQWLMVYADDYWLPAQTRNEVQP
jgi:glycerol transport system ATP-binding protein